MQHDQVVTLAHGPVTVLTLQRPKALNALNEAMLDALSEAIAGLAAVQAQGTCRCLVIRGSGSRAFAAGADIAAMQGMDGPSARKLSAKGQRIFAAIEHLAVPTVAMVQGYALGGGLELALACDLVIAAESAQFALPEVTLGLVPGFGGTWRLPRRVGAQAAAYLALTGQRIDASHAQRLGLVAEVVADEHIETRTAILAEILASHPPEATLALKRMLTDGPRLSVDAALASEQGAFSALMTTHLAQQAITAFVEKNARK